MERTMRLDNYRCTACGAKGNIILTRDIGFCNECGTPEHYEKMEGQASYREQNKQPILKNQYNGKRKDS